MEKIIIGILSGAAYGVLGYLKNKDKDPKMPFRADMFLVTVGLSALIGIVVDVNEQPGYVDEIMAASVPLGVITALNKALDVGARSIQKVKKK